MEPALRAGLNQLVRIPSAPRYRKRPVGLMVKTRGFQPRDRGSSPRRVTTPSLVLGDQPACKAGALADGVRFLGSVPRRRGATDSISGFEPEDGGSNPSGGASHSGVAQREERLLVTEDERVRVLPPEPTNDHGVLVVRRGFDLVEGGSSAADFCDDLFGGLVPDEGLGVVVPVFGPDLDGIDEVGHAGEHASA